MILADVLYDLSNHILITDHWSSDLIRMVIAVVASITAILLARLYLGNRTGRMNLCAGVGAVWTYCVVAWAQLVAVSNPATPHDLSALNVGVLAAVTLSMVGTLQAMNVHLFRHTEPRPGTIRRTLDQIDRAAELAQGNSDKLDAIDHAVNTRPTGEPTISEDVRALAQDAEKKKKKGKA
jgi:hypothetical protein